MIITDNVTGHLTSDVGGFLFNMAIFPRVLVASALFLAVFPVSVAPVDTCSTYGACKATCGGKKFDLTNLFKKM